MRKVKVLTTHILLSSIILLLFLPAATVHAQQGQFISVEKVATAFRALLEKPTVDARPSFKSFNTDSVNIEKGFIYAEQNEKVPILIYKPITKKATSFPVVVCLHGTGGYKEQSDITELMYRLSKKGIMAVAIDARYHGERTSGGAGSRQEYVEAIIKAWKNTDTKNQQHPFFYETVFDLWRLTDYLITRKDVEPGRIGMMGISMGGIQTWMAASVDKRIRVAVPIIAAQSFSWSLENDQWQGRAGTIWAAHQEAARDLGDSIVTKKSVKSLWAKLVPGITDTFDCPSMIRLFAPRPLLLLSTEKDKNCPLPGAELAFKAATDAYALHHASDKLKIHVEPNETHRLIKNHIEMAIEWFGKWL